MPFFVVNFSQCTSYEDLNGDFYVEAKDCSDAVDIATGKKLLPFKSYNFGNIHTSFYNRPDYISFEKIEVTKISEYKYYGAVYSTYLVLSAVSDDYKSASNSEKVIVVRNYELIEVVSNIFDSICTIQPDIKGVLFNASELELSVLGQEFIELLTSLPSRYKLIDSSAAKLIFINSGVVAHHVNKYEKKKLYNENEWVECMEKQNITDKRIYIEKTGYKTYDRDGCSEYDINIISIMYKYKGIDCRAARIATRIPNDTEIKEEIKALGVDIESLRGRVWENYEQGIEYTVSMDTVFSDMSYYEDFREFIFYWCERGESGNEASADMN